MVLAETVKRFQGRCRNTIKQGEEATVVFNGHCVLKQKSDPGQSVFVVDLDNGTTFRFRGTDPSNLHVESHGGLWDVRLNHDGDREVFVWDERNERHRLVVKMDTEHQPSPSVSDDDDDNNTGTIIGAVAGVAAAALIAGLLSNNDSADKDDDASQEVATSGPAPGLQDLVGARGSSGESALQQRGYQLQKVEKSDVDAYGYWLNPSSGQCVIVRTTDGRYASLTATFDTDCRK